MPKMPRDRDPRFAGAHAPNRETFLKQSLQQFTDLAEVQARAEHVHTWIHMVAVGLTQQQIEAMQDRLRDYIATTAETDPAPDLEGMVRDAIEALTEDQFIGTDGPKCAECGEYWMVAPLVENMPEMERRAKLEVVENAVTDATGLEK